VPSNGTEYNKVSYIRFRGILVGIQILVELFVGCMFSLDGDINHKEKNGIGSGAKVSKHEAELVFAPAKQGLARYRAL
jgi:hypothetical protein